MKKKFLLIMLAFSMLCSSMYSSAKSRGTITVISKTKTFSVPKKYGKIKKVLYSYPDKKAKGKVTVKQTGTKIKITGKKNGRVNVKIRFKSNAVKSYRFLVNIKKSKPKITATPVVTASASPVTSPSVSSTLTTTVSPKITSTVSPTLIPTSSSTVEPTIRPTVEPTVRPTAEPTVEPTVVPTSSPIVRPTSVLASSPTIKPTVSPTIVPVFTVRPIVSVEPTVSPTIKPTAEPTLEPTVSPTTEPTSTPTLSDDVEHEDISTLKALDEEFDVISTNFYEYTKAFIDRYFNDDGICTRFYIRAKTIKNITDETRVPDCHVKFYDENGYFVCEYQNSNDSGSTWNKTLKPNEESIILYLAGTSPSDMGVTSKDFSKRVKYWKLVDIEDKGGIRSEKKVFIVFSCLCSYL